ncbi:porin family protein [Pontibacter vulgaris]|uniref:porin family protein n=1 Tax=Pontibacter vulgaris TaxID=2905679 RepID=UPI001FA7C123|nr:porin family protein [Pontibacter vulgaris]
MKAFILPIVLILSLPVQAQFFHVGAKAGGGFSNALGSDAKSNVNYKAGLHSGLILNLEFSPVFATQLEPQYSTKGFTYDDYPTEQGEALAGDVALRYLEIPLIAQVKKASLFAEAGPYIGFLLNTKSDVNRLQLQPGQEPIILGEREFITDEFEKIDYGYAVGGGLILDTGFFVSVRNTGGFSSFSKDLNQRNFNWQLSIGYIMPSRAASNY